MPYHTWFAVPLLADINLWGQLVEPHDAVVILMLVVLEGVLSIDNALVLGLLAKRLPKSQQKRALTYGLVGAFVFRLLAIATATYLLRWRVVKLLGGGYLLYVAIKHLFFESKAETVGEITLDEHGHPKLVDEQSGRPLGPEAEEAEIQERAPIPVAPTPPRQLSHAHFWPTVAVIELTDIAFAVDSILAAIALVGSPPPDHPSEALHPKLWVVVAGGMLGVILMRVAAVMFIRLLEAFPRFELSAYLLVAVIGGKLLADWGLNTVEHPHRVDFHDWQHPAFWIFWLAMVASFCIGFIPERKK